MAPPKLPAKESPLSVAVPPRRERAPPYTAVFPVKMTSLTVSVPELAMPPPNKDALPFSMLKPVKTACTPPSTWKIPVALLPLTLSGLVRLLPSTVITAAPLLATPLSSSTEASVMVPPARLGAKVMLSEPLAAASTFAAAMAERSEIKPLTSAALLVPGFCCAASWRSLTTRLRDGTIRSSRFSSCNLVTLGRWRATFLAPNVRLIQRSRTFMNTQPF
jgi:hypothetical protein